MSLDLFLVRPSPLDGTGAGGIQGSRPPTATRPTPNNLRHPVSGLLGREGDLAAIRHLIADGRQRMVTLLGVGGAGKTRLALQTATDLLPEFQDGVWFVDLAPTTNPELVPQIVAGVLGVMEHGDVPIRETLCEFLREKRLLLVVDNCEHLIEASAALAERLLTACPHVHMLATSREPLRIDGERRWQVRPLAVPQRGGSVSFDDLATVAAVRLFAERAQAIDADFRLTEVNIGAVGRICTLLDGIPLAIELAASQVSVLAVHEIAERLEGDLRVLAGGRRTAPIRQQTMEAALGWSYDLLTPVEQALFRRLAPFAGGFDLEAVNGVVGVGGDSGMAKSPSAPPPVTGADDGLRRLVDKSLVVTEPLTAGRRFRMLEPVRQYAQHLLLASGDANGAYARHAAYYAALAERAQPNLHGPEQIAWLERLEGERNNLRAALGWITEQGEVEDGLKMAITLVPFWEVRGHFGEGRRWLDVALARHGSLTPSDRRAARLAVGRLAFWHGDLTAAVAHFRAIASAGEGTGAAPPDADALTWLGAALGAQESFAEAEAILQEAHVLQEARGDAWGAAWALFNLGRAVGNRATGTGYNHPDMHRTSELLEESLRRFRTLGDLRFMAVVSMYQGIILVHAGESARPAHLLREGLSGFQAVGEQGFLFSCVIALSFVAVVLGQPVRAARLVGAAEALGQALGASQTPVFRRTHQNALSRICPLLAADDFTAARAEGWIMTLDDVLSEARDLASAAAMRS